MQPSTNIELPRYSKEELDACLQFFRTRGVLTKGNVADYMFHSGLPTVSVERGIRLIFNDKLFSVDKKKNPGAF